ncbi:hypothetical protein AAE478_004630 [Parahypoxylon ruwenzoriense]
MPSLMGANMPSIPYQSYSSDLTLDELSRQLAISESMRRISRGSTGQRTPGAMRIVKPSSASNSPQAMAARRRTMMNDGGLARRRQQVLDQAIQQQMQDYTYYSTPEEPVKRSSRPVSWHPSSHIQQPYMHIPIPQPDFSQYVGPAPIPFHQADIYSGYQNLPPTPAAYSGQTSPMSTVSPLCLPFSTASQLPHATPVYVSQDTWNSAPQFMPDSYASSGSPGESEPFPPFTSQTSFTWDEFATHGFNACTAPPTPDEFQPIQQLQPTVTPEESIPYQPLEESEEEGEILVGMGLYDPPNKTETDPELDNYRTTTSQLLGTTYRGGGQGWKLEEAWEPPVTDDEEEDGEDAEEGEDGEECEAEQEPEKDRTVKSTPAQQDWI